MSDCETELQAQREKFVERLRALPRLPSERGDVVPCEYVDLLIDDIEGETGGEA